MRIQANIARDAEKAFGDARLADTWLDRPSPLYGGRPPRQAIAEPAHRERARRQLNWFSGLYADKTPEPALRDVLSDPMINMALASAGSGPEELLALCQAAKDRQHAA